LLQLQQKTVAARTNQAIIPAANGQTQAMQFKTRRYHLTNELCSEVMMHGLVLVVQQQ
jgi:hypothetical protein